MSGKHQSRLSCQCRPLWLGKVRAT